MAFMIRIRSLIPGYVILAILVQLARAQAPATDGGLNLTPRQEAEINQLSRAEHASFLAVVRDPALTEEQRLAKAAKVHRTFVSAIEAVLSPSQLAKSRIPLAPVGSWPWPSAIVSERLPAEQRQQLAALAQEAIRAHNGIVANAELSNLQKRMAAEAKEREIREKFRLLLTPAQRALLTPAVRIEIGRPLLAMTP